MTYDFGPLLQFVEMTAQYSNAVLVAVMPYITDCARRLELCPIEQLNANAVHRLVIHPQAHDLEASVWFTNTCVFNFSRGHIDGYYSRRAYSKERDPQAVPKWYGTVKMSEAEAVALARETIRKLGYSLPSLFADLSPEVEPPRNVGTNVIPFYIVRWLTPHGEKAASIEINASKRTVESIRFMGHNLDLPSPKLGVNPALTSYHPFFGTFKGVNPDYGYKLLPIVMDAVTNYAAKLQIPLPSPLTTNHIKRFFVGDNGGWPHSELELTNGLRFLYRNTTIVGYSAADDLFSVASEKRKAPLSDFAGTWRMSDREMIKLARTTLARLGYPKGFVHTEQKPQLMLKPPGQFAKLIPRCKIHWVYPNSAYQSQWCFVEIDADKKEVKAVHFDDESFRKEKPPIAVPIALPEKP